jgi:hypothetical protein
MVMSIAAAAAGCDEAMSVTGPTPQLEATFSSIQAQIFESSDPSGRPACVSCHNAAGQQFAGGLNLQHDVAYANLVNVASLGQPSAVRVLPGNPDGSYIVHKLDGRSTIAGVRMPPNGPYLTDGQIAVIRTWIERGAAND